MSLNFLTEYHINQGVRLLTVIYVVLGRRLCYEKSTLRPLHSRSHARMEEKVRPRNPAQKNSNYYWKDIHLESLMKPEQRLDRFQNSMSLWKSYAYRNQVFSGFCSDGDYPKNLC